jgi:LPS-assembly protein
LNRFTKPLRLEALRLTIRSCYGLRLKLFVEAYCLSVSLSIRFVRICHEHFCRSLFFAISVVLLLLSSSLPAQQVKAPADLPAPGQNRFFAEKYQETRGDWTYLRGGCRIVTQEEEVNADEIDFNTVTNTAYLRGHVHYQNFSKGDKVEALRGEYNLKTQEGIFYTVKGTSPAHGIYEPWLLRTTNPFYFEGEWAERHHDRYIVHNGFLTDCNLPKPWWTLHAPMFDVIPNDRAIAHNALFRLKKYPIFYLPAFYRPLGRKDRQSGFLTPNIGNSSVLGTMIGEGFYWAINRSYDATYRIQDFTSRGYAHTLDFRGKPTQKSDFDFELYGVNDRGLPLGNGQTLKEGGLQFDLVAKTELPDGWVGKLDLRYLSSYLFRQSFTQSFNEAIFSEVNSVGYLQRHWQDYTVNIGFERQQLFESIAPGDLVNIQKLPSVDFIGKDKEFLIGSLPAWFSFDTNMSLLRRQEPTFQTSNVVHRENVEPHVMTAFHFKGFELVPGLEFHGTNWGDSLAATDVLNRVSLFRKAADVTVEFLPPSLERIFPAPKWLGQKIKHVIEPRVNYRYITGVDNFNNIIKFDETDFLSNTNQVKLSVINRFYLKNKQGQVNEFLDWEVAQERYFDPTFGGALVPGQPNVFSVTEDVTPFTFITRPRRYSPVDSILRVYAARGLDLDWRVDYDPVYQRFTNSIFYASYRVKQNYFISGGYRNLDPDPIIQAAFGPSATHPPYASQITTTLGYGGSLRKGWNAAVTAYYDLYKAQLEYFFFQATYNTDCCGFSLQARRFAFGTRNENQFLFSFTIANVGSFGTFRRQDRIF